MAENVILPRLGISMVEATIVEWKVKEEEWVNAGQPLVDIETEKVSYELPSVSDGIIHIVVPAGETVPVGQVLAILATSEDEYEEIKAGVVASVTEPPISMSKVVRQQPVRVSPVARRIAEEHNIDITTLEGTGPEGRIVKEDVLRAVEEGKAAAKSPAEEEPPVEGKVIPLSSMRKTIARRMVESFQSAPHFYLTMEVDTKELEEFRQKLIPLVNDEVRVRLTITDLLIKAVATALEDCPEVNCAFDGDRVKLFDRIDIGLVTAVEGGLMVPVIRQANKLSLPQIAQVRAGLTEKARERKVSLDEITGSTFTISNLGMFGIDQFSAILQPPEGAILAVGRIIDKPVVLEGEIAIRSRMALTLSIDHRVLDGVSGARFLQRVKELIENPNLLPS